MILVVSKLDLVVIGSEGHRILRAKRHRTAGELFAALDEILCTADVDLLSVDGYQGNQLDATLYFPSTPLQHHSQLHNATYLRQRYNSHIRIQPNLDRTAAHFTAISPPTNSILVGLGHHNHIIFQIPRHTTARLPKGTHVLPHPLNPSLALAYIQIRDQGLARSSIRDAYSNGNWSTFNSLVNIVNIGGSVGLDNKLFSFYYPTPQATLSGRLQGYYRYELGTSTNEFADLRANSRCIVESQFLTIKRYIEAFERSGVIGQGCAVYLTGEPTQSGSLCSAIANILAKKIYLPHSTMCEKSTQHTLTPLLGMGLYSWYNVFQPSTALEETVRFRRKSYNHSIPSPTSTPPLTPLLTPQIGYLSNRRESEKSNLTPVAEQFELPTITPTTISFEQRYQFSSLTQLEFDNDPYIKPDSDLGLIYAALLSEHERLEAISVGSYARNSWNV
ncbi:hypothetical protein E3P94_01716 [Wallemia ichthyophaga]|nr:hypothetical protein E3P98_01666 [Wallemia ichthyophaga]TIB00500.1 hypothetical protein E3P95_01681 [Wallemia ichthyophaga]TIB01650.1 hypothetical protein E3P94_01716 [Wallemia ichthyophaga]